jgi:hypothetical protein
VLGCSEVAHWLFFVFPELRLSIEGFLLIVDITKPPLKIGSSGPADCLDIIFAIFWLLSL